MMKQIVRGLLLLAGLVLGNAAQAGKVTYVYTDIQGTPVMESDAQGNITARFDYTPYGVPVQGLSGSPNGPGYTGHVNDPDTGFVYMQARYYDPVVGRFLSVDQDHRFFARYGYVQNNPVGFSDPDCNTDCTKMRRLSDQTASVTGIFDESGGDVAAAMVASRVLNEHFVHYYNMDPANFSSGIPFPLPRATRSALLKILMSPFGSKLENQLLSGGGVIELVWVSPDSAFATFGNEIWYNPDVGAFIDSHSDFSIRGDGLDSTSLDVLLTHELGHTVIGHFAMGQDVIQNDDRLNTKEEIRAVRMYENPYRVYRGLPLRCSYFTEGDICNKKH